jgi:hypothetical protein
VAADFDEAAWKEDVIAFAETCRTLSLPTAIERSRSGNGAHVWFFFADFSFERVLKNVKSRFVLGLTATPQRRDGHLIQYTGRLHRLHPAKREVRIYDYVDSRIPMLARMFAKRLRGYRSLGYAQGEAPLGFGEIDDDYVLGRDWEDGKSEDEDDS